MVHRSRLDSSTHGITAEDSRTRARATDPRDAALAGTGRRTRGHLAVSRVARPTSGRVRPAHAVAKTIAALKAIAVGGEPQYNVSGRPQSTCLTGDVRFDFRSR